MSNEQKELEDQLKEKPEAWEVRKKLAHLLYNQGQTEKAAELVWDAPEIPSVDLELGFAIKVLGKGAPSRAIRLLNALHELNEGKAVQNLGLANALLHHGLVMQAARFYGAAVAVDPTLANADLEHFLLWVDDSEKIWGDFQEEFPPLEELPWMKRDAEQAELLKKSMKGHTTPISIPGLQRALAEEATNPMYVQSKFKGDEVSPPPAVTIPMDRVEEKHRVIDNERGAGAPVTAEEAKAAAGPQSGSMGVGLPAAAKPITPPQQILPPGAEKPTQPAEPAPAAEETPEEKPAVPSPVPTVLLTAAGTPAKTAPQPTKLLTDGKIQIKRSQ